MADKPRWKFSQHNFMVVRKGTSQLELQFYKEDELIATHVIWSLNSKNDHSFFSDEKGMIWRIVYDRFTKRIYLDNEITLHGDSTKGVLFVDGGFLECATLMEKNLFYDLQTTRREEICTVLSFQVHEDVVKVEFKCGKMGNIFSFLMSDGEFRDVRSRPGF